MDYDDGVGCMRSVMLLRAEWPRHTGRTTDLHRTHQDALLDDRVSSCCERTYCRNTPAEDRRRSTLTKLQPVSPSSSSSASSNRRTELAS